MGFATLLITILLDFLCEGLESPCVTRFMLAFFMVCGGRDFGEIW